MANLLGTPARLLGAGLLALSVAAPLAAQPGLIADINTAGGFEIGSFPREPVDLGDGRVVFFARDLLHGHEPWVTDGTAAGTRLLADVLPGPAPSEPRLVAVVGGRVLFIAFSDQSFETSDLWVTDGTPEGTVRLTATGLIGQSRVGILGEEVLFASDSLELGPELWATDGTPLGTRLVADVVPGPVGSQPSGGLTAEAGTLLFTARVPGLGETLWATDGTPAGTRFVADPDPEENHESFERLTAFDGGVLFVVDDGVHGTELWVSDGTAAGTRLVRDLTPGAAGTEVISEIRVVGGTAYFLARTAGVGRLWATDGTAAGTRSLAAPAGALADALVDDPAAGGGVRLFFSADDGHGFEPWTSDGTQAGTRMVADLRSGTLGSVPEHFRPTPRGMVFVANDGSHGREPWLTDGTAAGTRMIADLCPGSCTYEPSLLGTAGDDLVIAGHEGPADLALWGSDGTPQGTVRLTAPGQGFLSTLYSLSTDRALYFSASDRAHGGELWISDATPGGTHLVTDLGADGSAGSFPGGLVEAPGKVYFTADDGVHGREPWVSDGTAAGTRMVADLVAGEQDYSGLIDVRLAVAGGHQFALVSRVDPFYVRLWRLGQTQGGAVLLLETPEVSCAPPFTCPLVAAGGRVFARIGDELWVSDGTPAGTRRLLAGSLTLDTYQRPGAFGGEVYFSASAAGGDTDFEPWVSDGTAAGTRRLVDLDPANDSDPADFIAVGGRLYFTASGAGRIGRVLWVSDGTAAGTRPVVEDGLDERFSFPTDLTVVGSRLVFFAGQPAARALWAIRGNGTGPVLLGLLRPGVVSSQAPAIAVAGGRMFFLVQPDFVSPAELWVTDGTVEGTARAVPPLPPNRRMTGLWPAGADVVVLAEAAALEKELWVTDGTAAGTRRIAALSGFGFPIDSPPELAVVGPRVLFGRDDPASGAELWGARLDVSLPPSTVTPPAVPDLLTAAAEAGSASALRLAWRDRSADETGFEVTWVTPGTIFDNRPLVVPADTHEVLLPGFASNVPATFRVRSFNGAGASAWSGEASAAPFAAEDGPCTANDAALCLLGDRFEARVWWHDQHNFGFGTGHAAPFPGSARTGTFWFFNQANIELIVKELDGRPVNGHFWTFFGALSDVEYWVTVTDTSARANRTYHNRPGEVCGMGDTASFPGAAPAGGAPLLAPATGGADAGLPRAIRALAFEPAPLAAPDATGPCVPGPGTLCLLGGRFRVEVAWHDQHNGGDGVGRAVAGTDKAGYFWFFNQANVELVVKALDGRPVNGRFWIFYGALSDVEYTITVTDTVANETRTYVNQPGDICGRADTTAF